MWLDRLQKSNCLYGILARARDLKRNPEGGGVLPCISHLSNRKRFPCLHSSLSFFVVQFCEMLVNVFWSYATTANGKEMYKSDMHVQKKPGCFAINPNLFLFAVLVAVGRCLVFVEPTSAFRLNKISHLKNLSSVDSDGSEWNFIPGFVPNM